MLARPGGSPDDSRSGQIAHVGGKNVFLPQKFLSRSWDYAAGTRGLKKQRKMFESNLNEKKSAIEKKYGKGFDAEGYKKTVASLTQKSNASKAKAANEFNAAKQGAAARKLKNEAGYNAKKNEFTKSTTEEYANRGQLRSGGYQEALNSFDKSNPNPNSAYASEVQKAEKSYQSNLAGQSSVLQRQLTEAKKNYNGAKGNPARAAALAKLNIAQKAFDKRYNKKEQKAVNKAGLYYKMSGH